LSALPDVPDKRGPLAGMLAAMRWRLDVSWLFMACDLPQVSSMSVEWLIGKRAPGVWAILPRLPGTEGVETRDPFRRRFRQAFLLRPS
jgi:molybdopterin-guanine dinucleotide biosynthesis protein A